MEVSMSQPIYDTLDKAQSKKLWKNPKLMPLHFSNTFGDDKKATCKLDGPFSPGPPGDRDCSS
jgi:hypothetical protein